MVVGNCFEVKTSLNKWGLFIANMKIELRYKRESCSGSRYSQFWSASWVNHKRCKRCTCKGKVRQTDFISVHIPTVSYYYSQLICLGKPATGDHTRQESKLNSLQFAYGWFLGEWSDPENRQPFVCLVVVGLISFSNIRSEGTRSTNRFRICLET